MRGVWPVLAVLSVLLLSACNLVLGMDALDSGSPESGGNAAGGSVANAAGASGAAGGGAPPSLGGFTAAGAGGTFGLVGGAAGAPAVGGSASSGGGGAGGAAGSGSDAGSAGAGGHSGASGNAGAGGAGIGGSAGAGGTAGSAGAGGGGGSSGTGTPCLTKSPDASCSCAGYAARDYWFCATYLTFEAAQNKCQAVNMHLPKIESQGEDTFLYKTAAAKSMGEYFLGAIDAQYSHWSPGQPDGSGGCTVVQNNGLWDDRTCFDQRKYLCESARAVKP